MNFNDIIDKKKNSGAVKMSRKAFENEHEKLTGVLKRGKKSELNEELKEQSKELSEEKREKQHGPREEGRERRAERKEERGERKKSSKPVGQSLYGPGPSFL